MRILEFWFMVMFKLSSLDSKRSDCSLESTDWFSTLEIADRLEKLEKFLVCFISIF